MRVSETAPGSTALPFFFLSSAFGRSLPGLSTHLVFLLSFQRLFLSSSFSSKKKKETNISLPVDLVAFSRFFFGLRWGGERSSDAPASCLFPPLTTAAAAATSSSSSSQVIFSSSPPHQAAFLPPKNNRLAPGMRRDERREAFPRLLTDEKERAEA